MGFDHSELGISGSTGVTATIMVIVTLLCIYEVNLHYQQIMYREAQHRLMFLLSAPVVIGWMTFGILYNPESERIVQALLFGYKGIYLFIFNRYCERLLGWVDKGGVYVYSRDKSIQSLQALGETRHRLLCSVFGKIPLRTPEEAEGYLLRTRIYVGQMTVVLILIGAIVIPLEYAFPVDYINYGSTSFESGAIYINITRTLSTIVATYTVFLYSITLSSIPRLKHLEIFHKFAVVKFAILLPEMQPLIISIFASAGIIADDYSASEQVAFINSLLVCDEMLIVAFVQLLIFDPKDYEVHRKDDETTELLPSLSS